MLVLWTVLSIWNIIYINEFYSDKQVQLGYTTVSEDDGKQGTYLTLEKKQFVLFNFCWMCLAAAYHFYFYYVCNQYANKLEDEEE